MGLLAVLVIAVGGFMIGSKYMELNIRTLVSATHRMHL